MTLDLKVPFHLPAVTGKEREYLGEVLDNRVFMGGHRFVERCTQWFEQHLGVKGPLLTGSCTHALEMAAMLADIQPGDEVIMPSFTFVSSANPFVLRGASIVFVDVRPDTMNIDDSLIEQAITARTKVIVPVHYAGVGCEMDAIIELAAAHDLLVIEDAAQGMMSSYKERPLGTFGGMAAFSFHGSKNLTCGEGGLLVCNDPRFRERAEILRDKGTNRGQFFRGQVDKYTWVDLGSNYAMDEFRAAILLAQLEEAEAITTSRIRFWHRYAEGLEPLVASGAIELQRVPDHCQDNAHVFYLKAADLVERTALIEFLKADDIQALFHFVPLHTSPAGKKYGRFVGADRYTSSDSARLLRLPLYYEISDDSVDRVVERVRAFYGQG